MLSRRLLSSTAIALAVGASIAAASPTAGPDPAAAPDPAAGVDPAAGIAPVRDADFYQNGRFAPAQVELGRLLFFDKILSGNHNIACATCHHPAHGTSDQLALSLGEGAVGLARDRQVTAEAPLLGRVPRNAQALYFLGARQFTRLFHDGRVEVDPNHNWPSGFWSPAREQLPQGLDNVLAVQAVFPVRSPIEMAGHKGENEIADAVAVDRLAGPEGAWDRIARRLHAIPEYVERFRQAFAEIDAAEDITYVHAANAIAAFETVAFRADHSPFDHYLETRDPAVMAPAAYRGMALFYGEAGCSTCHSGKFQTDQEFHAIAMPQLGPGKSDGFDRSYWQASGYPDRLEDHGRARVTARPEDRHTFRTPSLRNVALTAPYGHAGAYATLAAVIRHHADPVTALERFQVASVDLPALGQVIQPRSTGSRLVFQPLAPGRLDAYLARDRWVQGTPALRQAIATANQLDPVDLGEAEIADLVAFVRALTDPRSRQQHHLVPERVPSGLPVDQVGAPRLQASNGAPAEPTQPASD